MERAYEAGEGTELREEDRDNSIFVSAFKRHLQSGSLKERLDTLLTDAAAGNCLLFFCAAYSLSLLPLWQVFESVARSLAPNQLLGRSRRFVITLVKSSLWLTPSRMTLNLTRSARRELFSGRVLTVSVHTGAS